MSETALATDEEARRKIIIRNERGLHARAAGKLVRLAAQFEADVWVMKDDMVVGAQSIMGLMMLSAGPGSTIELWVRGPDAATAMAELVDLIETRGFDEDINGSKNLPA